MRFYLHDWLQEHINFTACHHSGSCDCIHVVVLKDWLHALICLSYSFGQEDLFHPLLHVARHIECLNKLYGWKRDLYQPSPAPGSIDINAPSYSDRYSHAHHGKNHAVSLCTKRSAAMVLKCRQKLKSLEASSAAVMMDQCLTKG